MICICVSMSMEIVADVASFDAELLQLTEVSPLALKSNPSFVESLFEQWLSLPDTNRLVLENFEIECCLHWVGYASRWVSMNIWSIVLVVEFRYLSFLLLE